MPIYLFLLLILSQFAVQHCKPFFLDHSPPLQLAGKTLVLTLINFSQLHSTFFHRQAEFIFGTLTAFFGAVCCTNMFLLYFPWAHNNIEEGKYIIGSINWCESLNRLAFNSVFPRDAIYKPIIIVFKVKPFLNEKMLLGGH